MAGQWHTGGMSGWKRIGIVTSVLWILGGGIYTYNWAADSYAHNLRVECYRAENVKDWAAVCDKPNSDYLEGNRGVPLKITAVFTLVPILPAWGFAYLILFLVRWVKRGFISPGNSNCPTTRG